MAVTLVGPFGFAHGFNKVAGSNTYGPVSPVEALGVWPAANYRLDAAGGAHLTGLAGAIAALALLVGVAWWVRRRELAVPIALGACAVALPRLASLQRRLLAGQGADDRGAAGDAGRHPAAAGGAAATSGRGRARLGAAARLALGAAGAARLGRARRRLRRRRGLLELPRPARRAGRPARPRRRAARLPADRARRAGALRRPGPLRRLRADRRRHPRAAGRVPRLGGLPEPGEAVRHRRRLQPDRLRLLLPGDARPLPLRDHRPRRLEQPGAGRASAASPPPPPTCSGSGPGRRPPTATCCSRGPRPAALAGCASPEIRILLASPGRASLFPTPVIGAKATLGRGDRAGHRRARTSQALDLPAGPLEPLAAVLLPLRPDPHGAGLQRAAGGGARRPAPEHDQPRQRRPVLAGGALRQRGRADRVHDRGRRGERPPEPHRLRRQGLRRRAGRRPGRAAPDRAAQRRLRRLDRLVRVTKAP